MHFVFEFETIKALKTKNETIKSSKKQKQTLKALEIRSVPYQNSKFAFTCDQ